MLKKIGNFIVLVVCLVASTVFAYAAEEKVSMSISQKEVILGDSIILTIRVEGISNPQAPELPAIPNFDVRFMGVRQESFSSMTVVVNGKQVKNERSGGGYSFDFELTPKIIGALQVPSLPISINGRGFVTQSFQIDVFDQSEKRQDIFIDLHTDKTQAYLGEKILVTFKWYFSKDIGDYRINIPWLDSMKNFLVTDPELDQNLTYQRLIINGDKQIAALKSREFYKGQEYMVVSFQKVLTPIASGMYVLDPVFLKCDVITGYRRAKRRSTFSSFFDSDFDDFFGVGRDAVTEPFATRSNEIALTIKEVPGQDKPAAYNGAVGNFSFNIDVKPVSLKVGEPITLTMKVAGSGNIEQLELPHIPDIESFKSYEPESKINISKEGTEVKGEKIFEKVLIPRHAGDYKIPKISFAFFDPELGMYQTETRGPFNIHVTKAEKEDEVRVIAIASDGSEETQKRELKLLKKEIHYIMTDIGNIDFIKKPIYENLLAWIMFLLAPILILISMFIFGRTRQRLSTDIAFARNRTALKSSKEFFNQAELALGQGQARDFYDSLIRGLNTYLAEKLNRQPGGIDQAVADELEAKGLKEQDGDALRAIYSNANEVIFSSLSVDSERLKQDFKAAYDIVTRLERILR